MWLGGDGGEGGTATQKTGKGSKEVKSLIKRAIEVDERVARAVGGDHQDDGDETHTFPIQIKQT